MATHTIAITTHMAAISEFLTLYTQRSYIDAPIISADTVRG